MTNQLQIQNIPSEIWNCIVFFTEDDDFELIEFLMFYLKTFNLQVDISYLQKIHQRNTVILPEKDILTIFPDLINNFRFLDWSSLYPSSMITTNIPHQEYITEIKDS